MKNLFSKSVSLFAATSVVFLSTLSAQPAKANAEVFSSQPGSLIAQESESFGSLIARETHLFVSSPYDEVIRFQGSHAHSLLLRLERPLYNYSGEVVIPAGVDIIAEVGRTDSGQAEIIATSLLIEGMEIELEAVSAPLSVQETEVRSAADTAEDFNRRYGLAFNAAGSVLFDEDDSLNALVSNAAPLVGSMFSKAKVERTTTIPKNRPILLKLSERLIVPVEIAQAMRNGSAYAPQSASTPIVWQPQQQPTFSPQTQQSPVDVTAQSADFFDVTYTSANLSSLSFCSLDSECLETDNNL